MTSTNFCSSSLLPCTLLWFDLQYRINSLLTTSIPTHSAGHHLWMLPCMQYINILQRVHILVACPIYLRSAELHFRVGWDAKSRDKLAHIPPSLSRARVRIPATLPIHMHIRRMAGRYCLDVRGVLIQWRHGSKFYLFQKFQIVLLCVHNRAQR